MTDAAIGGFDDAFLPEYEPPAPHDGAGGSPPGRRVRRVLRWTWHVLFVAAWLLILAMGALTWLPHVTNVKTDIIIGPSMEPTIPLYSVIVVEAVDPASVRTGDVITFQEPGNPNRKVTHRVAAIERGEHGPGFITKGDNNDVRDPWRVEYSGSAYRVKTHVPRLGWLMLKAQTKAARLLLVVLPVLVLLVEFLRWLWRGDDEEGGTERDDDDGAFVAWPDVAREAA